MKTTMQRLALSIVAAMLMYKNGSLEKMRVSKKSIHQMAGVSYFTSAEKEEFKRELLNHRVVLVDQIDSTEYLFISTAFFDKTVVLSPQRVERYLDMTPDELDGVFELAMQGGG